MVFLPAFNGAVESFHGFTRLGQEVEDDNLVDSSAQPNSWDVKGILRADAPESPEVMAVDPDGAFAEAVCVEESVARSGEREVAAEECRRIRRMNGGGVFGPDLAVRGRHLGSEHLFCGRASRRQLGV